MLFIVSMGLGRGGAFLFQWFIVRNTTPTFSQVVTNSRRLLVIIILVIVLHEPHNMFTWISVNKFID